MKLLNQNYHVFHIRARDRFGDYGVIGFALSKKESSIWILESLLMSCRALGRGIEEAFLYFLVTKAREDGNQELRVVFTKSEKNTPAQEFLKKYFKNYIYDLNTAPELPLWVNLVIADKKS
jgi:FkbH-like protein